MCMRNENAIENRNEKEKEHKPFDYIDDGHVTIPVSGTKPDEGPASKNIDAENGREAFILALKNQSDKPVQEDAKISKGHTEYICKLMTAICLSDIMNSVTARANNLSDHFEISTNLASAIGRYLNMPKEKMVQMLSLCDDTCNDIYDINAVADALISDRSIIVSKIIPDLKKKPRYYTIDVLSNRCVDGITLFIKRELDMMLRDSGLGHCFNVSVVAALQFTGSIRSYKNREGTNNISNKVLHVNPVITAIFEKDTTHNAAEE